MKLKTQDDLSDFSIKTIHTVTFPNTEKALINKNNNILKIFINEFKNAILSSKENIISIDKIYNTPINFSIGTYKTIDCKCNGKLDAIHSKLSKVKNIEGNLKKLFDVVKCNYKQDKFVFFSPYHFKKEKRTSENYIYKKNDNYTMYLLDFDFKTKDKKFDFNKFRLFLQSADILFTLLNTTSSFFQITRSKKGFRVYIPLKNSLIRDYEKAFRKEKLYKFATLVESDTKIYDNSRIFFPSDSNIIPILFINDYGKIFESNSTIFNVIEDIIKYTIKNYNKKDKDVYIYNISSLSPSTYINTNTNNNHINIIDNSYIKVEGEREIIYNNNSSYLTFFKRREYVREVIDREYMDNLIGGRNKDKIDIYGVLDMFNRFNDEDIACIRHMFGIGIVGLRKFLQYVSGIISNISGVSMYDYYYDSLEKKFSADDYFRLSLTPEEKSIGDLFFYSKTFTVLYLQSETSISRLPEHLKSKVRKDKSKHYYIPSAYLPDIVEYSLNNWGLNIPSLKHKISKVFKLSTIATNYKNVITRMFLEVINETITNGKCKITSVFPIEFKRGKYKKELYDTILDYILSIKDTKGVNVFYLEGKYLVLNKDSNLDFSLYLDDESEIKDVDKKELVNFLDSLSDLFSLLYTNQSISSFFYSINEVLVLNTSIRRIILRIYNFDEWCRLCMNKVYSSKLYDNVKTDIILFYESKSEELLDFYIQETKYEVA